MALTVNQADEAILSRTDTAVQEAFKNGVNNQSSVQIIKNALGYAAAQFQKVGEYQNDISNMSRAYFTGALAAFLSASKPVWTSIPQASMESPWIASSDLAYYKDMFGVVHFRGYISEGPSASSVLATVLPTGFRPNKNLEVQAFGTTDVNNQPVYVNFLTNGQMLVSAYPEVAAPPGWVYVSLDGVSFRTV